MSSYDVYMITRTQYTQLTFALIVAFVALTAAAYFQASVHVANAHAAEVTVEER